MFADRGGIGYSNALRSLAGFENSIANGLCMKKLLLTLLILAATAALCLGCVRQPRPAAPADEGKDLLSGKYRVLPRPGAEGGEDYFLSVRKSAEGWHADDGKHVLRFAKMPSQELEGFLGKDAAQSAQCAAAAMSMLCAVEPGSRVRENDKELIFRTGYFFAVVGAGMWEMEKVE